MSVTSGTVETIFGITGIEQSVIVVQTGCPATVGLQSDATDFDKLRLDTFHGNYDSFLFAILCAAYTASSWIFAVNSNCFQLELHFSRISTLPTTEGNALRQW